jgi:hypothetical protein
MAAKVYPEYQTRLREANAADFGDLLLWPTLALVNDADYRARWAGKFDWVHADEYQDVNFAQYTWLKALASHARRMFVVGDDDQSRSTAGAGPTSPSSAVSDATSRMRSTFASRRISAQPAISSPPPTPSSPRTRRGSARRCSPGKGRGLRSSS